jgi:hypothetical protein
LHGGQFSLFFLNMGTIRPAQEHTTLKVTRLYTGADGMSHFEFVPVKFATTPGVPSAIDQSEPMIVTKSYIVRCAPGFFSDWHNADVRRYVITIRGRAEIEVAGGEKFVAEPGKVVLAGDLTGKGHTFRVLGDTDWIAMFVDIGSEHRNS